MTDHYSTLGVGRDATEEQIKRAYRKRASKAHPDKGGSTEEMGKLNRAYAVLGDKQRRIAYDSGAADPGTGPTVDSEAAEGLMVFFDQAIDKDITDVCGYARKQLAAVLTKGQQMMATLRGEIARIERSRNRVRKRKGGENLYTRLCDKRIEHARETVANIEREQLVAKAALELLAEYESDPDSVVCTTMLWPPQSIMDNRTGGY